MSVAGRQAAAAGVVVLGTGRSGTSAVSGMFSAAGFHPGHAGELMLPDADNPRGYFESLAVFRANEEILRRLDATWFDPPPAAAQLSAAPWAAPKLASVLEHLLSGAGGAPLVLKDPRISALIALWGPVISELLHPVLVIRDPVEVAHSLLRRDGTPLPFSLAMWELQMALLLTALRGRVVTIAPYRELLGSTETPVAVVRAATAHLGQRRAARVTPDDAPAALDSSLHRNRAWPTDHEQLMTCNQLALWRWLEAMPAGDHTASMDPPGSDSSSVARVTVQSERDRQALAQRARVLEKRLEATRSEIDSVWAEYNRAVKRVQIAEAAQREADSARREAEEQLATMRARLAELENHRTGSRPGEEPAEAASSRLGTGSSA